MVDFAVEHRAAIDEMTGNKTMGLRKYEMSERDWRIAEQLRDTLKVCVQLALWR